MKSISKRTQRDYPLAFKLAVVDQVERGELSQADAQRCYGIQGHSTVLVWLRRYGQLDWSKESTKLCAQVITMSQSNQTPQQKIKELEHQLAEAELKADFFEAVVKVMDRDFGVRISKKRKDELLKKKRLKSSQ